MPKWKFFLRRQIFLAKKSKNVFMLKWMFQVFLKVRDTPLFERWNSGKLHFAWFKSKLFAYFQQYMAFKTQVLKIVLKICNEDISFKGFFLRNWIALPHRFFMQHLWGTLTWCLQHPLYSGCLKKTNTKKLK